jgi:hypothetical protein
VEQKEITAKKGHAMQLLNASIVIIVFLLDLNMDINGWYEI